MTADEEELFIGDVTPRSRRCSTRKLRFGRILVGFSYCIAFAALIVSSVKDTYLHMFWSGSFLQIDLRNSGSEAHVLAWYIGGVFVLFSIPLSVYQVSALHWIFKTYFFRLKHVAGVPASHSFQSPPPSNICCTDPLDGSNLWCRIMVIFTVVCLVLEDMVMCIDPPQV